MDSDHPVERRVGKVYGAHVALNERGGQDERPGELQLPGRDVDTRHAEALGEHLRDGDSGAAAQVEHVRALVQRVDEEVDVRAAGFRLLRARSTRDTRPRSRRSRA